jgi:hypothetical protein
MVVRGWPESTGGDAGPTGPASTVYMVRTARNRALPLIILV